MQMPQPPHRRAPRHVPSRRLLFIVAWGLFLATFGGGPEQAGGQQFRVPGFGANLPNQRDATPGVYLPTDRTLSRAVTRAKERIAEREYQEALTFLHTLLGREEDWFFDGVAGANEQRGVKATARRLIGELPPEGLDSYELLHGATARRQLESALAAGDRAGISQVVRQFYHTKAGYEAALVLAQMEADQGHRLAAAQLYKELLDTPRAAALFDPQLSVMAASNQLAAGDREGAAQTMLSVVERMPSAEVTLAGNKISLPTAESDMIAWLTSQLGKPSVVALSEVNWLTSRGDSARNAQHDGGRPHLRPRWQARVVNDPTTEAYLAGRSEDFAQRGVAVIPGARPIAVGDVIVMRTPENVVAIDFQTGKRVWETRPDEDLDAEETRSEIIGIGRVDRDQWPGQTNPLEERVWDDALVMSLSSDGERVFVIRGVTVNEEVDSINIPMGPVFGRPNGEVRATTNQLAAYDMSTQGKLVWELDGSRALAPLDGAFFLGAPLAIDGTLYVMAEVRSAIYLFALDPATGKVQWQQQLVGLEQSIGLDPVRRRAGATPSYDAGILVCPTSASAVVAIDVVKREFAWVYRYPREEGLAAEARNNFQGIPQPAVRSNDRWLDSSAVIGEGHVFITPPESSEVHCVELQTGKFAWKQRQGDSLFVAAVDNGHVLLVGAEGVQALRVSDGSIAWQQETVPFPAGSLPAGQGYLSEGRYYVPLTTGEIAAINIADGKLDIHEGATSGAALGNLVCYRGSILSQTALILDKYEQREVLERRVEESLAANPDDANALRELAELKRSEGDASESVALLKRAHEISPDDALTQEMLADVLLETLAEDYALYRDEVPLVTRLIHDRQQQIRLMQIEASGLEKLGQRLAAFDAYVRFADFTDEGPEHLRVEPEYQVRSDRWISGRLAALWQDATEQEREQMQKKVTARRSRVANARTTAELRHYLVHFQELPEADSIRGNLIEQLIDRKRLPEAEVELLAFGFGREDGKRERQRLLEELQNAASTEAPVTEISWPRGKVEAQLTPSVNNAAEARSIRNQGEQQGGYRPLRIEQDTSLGPALLSWFVAMDCSEVVARNGLGDDVFQLSTDQNNWAHQFRESSLVHAGRLGRLVIATLGGQVLAMNAANTELSSAGDVLWQTDPFGRYSADPLPRRRVVGEKVVRANRRPLYHTWSGRKRLGGAVNAGVTSLGPVTSRGVVFQEQDQLKCVDPLSGELLWVRADLPAGCELFGDMEYVFAADVSARTVHVLRTVDGRIVGKRDLPRHEWLMTVGRNVAEVGFDFNRSSRTLLIRISDMFSGDVLYSQEFPTTSRVAVIEPDAIAVFEPSGKFRLIDARTASDRINEQLQPFDDVQSINVMRSTGRLFLSVSGPPKPEFKPIVQQPDYPIVNGHVYAFSPETGKPLWHEPALVRNRGLILSQPRDLPLLVFADRKAVRSAASGGSYQLRLLCLDQNTGQTVYRNDVLPDTSITKFRIRGERDGDPTVAIETNAGKIQLTMTDKPRPPQPPANDDLESKREVEERGLRGIGRRMSGVLQGALEDPQERERLKQFQKVEEARKKMLEAQNERLQRLQLERAKQQPPQPQPVPQDGVEPTDDD